MSPATLSTQEGDILLGIPPWVGRGGLRRLSRRATERDKGAGGLRPPHPPASWGAAPPRRPAFLGGSAPRTPRKGAPRPWLQRLVAFSRPSNLSGAAALPGAELFLRISTFLLNKPLVPGSFAAWGRTFFSKYDIFFEHATCPGQLRCQGQNFFSKCDLFF